MTDEELGECLRSASMRWFAGCFDAHRRRAGGEASPDEWREALNAARCPAAGLQWRTRAVAIFEHGRQDDALRAILDSKAERTADEARRLLQGRAD